MWNTTIELDGLHKRYGSTTALDGMSFVARPGRVTGFVGPNGAGKSTAMRIILGLHAADAGRALIGGQPYRSLRHPLRHLGAVLDASAVHPARTGRNHLRWLARSQGLDDGRVDDVLARVGLVPAARRPAGGYSLGMRQRLGIAAALLGDPPAVMLDEPFNGMDPDGLLWLRGLLRDLADQGRVVLVSSHLMRELQGMADRLVVIGQGQVIAEGSVADLLAAVPGRAVRLRADAPGPAAAALSAAGAQVTGAGPDGLTVRGLAAEQVVAVLTAAGLRISELAPYRATLEEAYLELTRGTVEYRAGAPEPTP